MRRGQLKALVKRVQQLQQMKFNDTRQLLLKLGEAKGRYGHQVRKGMDVFAVINKESALLTQFSVKFLFTFP